MHKILLPIILIFTFTTCKEEIQNIELIIHNASIYTVDKDNLTAQAIAVSEGRIVYVGTSEEALKMKNPDTKVINARNNFVIPGFIEGHGHFSALGYSKINLNFLESKSWEEIIDSVEAKVKTVSTGKWIEGRGWHQEKWTKTPKRNIDGYPEHDSLSIISPNNPVILIHASGHSLFANKKAMEIAGVNIETPDPIGGRIVRNKSNEPIGVFEENAMDIIKNALQEYKKGLNKNELDLEWYKAIELAEKECLKNGITSFQDAGSKFDELIKYEELARKNNLDVRLWVMVRQSYDEMKTKLSQFKKIGLGNYFYTCNAIKSEVDGALGAFGAWLLKPYNDKPGFTGQNTTDIYEVKNIADLAIQNDMQFCVHAIGDRANKTVLDIYEGVAGKHPDKKDLRWRIEHAQHLDPKDFKRFKAGGFIASIQGIHCTSDAPFVEKRLGHIRAKYGSYPWRSLINASVHIANGTDTPIEDINPIKNFYASVTRKRIDTKMAFYPEQRMTRREAIKSYTIDNAYAAKEESLKGTITVGKLADFVILSKNLLKCKEEDILKTEILFTVVNGKIKYFKPNN